MLLVQNQFSWFHNLIYIWSCRKRFVGPLFLTNSWYLVTEHLHNLAGTTFPTIFDSLTILRFAEEFIPKVRVLCNRVSSPTCYLRIPIFRNGSNSHSRTKLVLVESILGTMISRLSWGIPFLEISAVSEKITFSGILDWKLSPLFDFLNFMSKSVITNPN